MPRFRADERGTAYRLGRRICPNHPEPDSSRGGSLFCKEVDLLVNGNGSVASPLRRRLGPESKWQARLVRVVVDGVRE